MPSATEVDLDRSSINDNVTSGTYDAPVLPAAGAAEQTTAQATATKVLKFSPSLEVHGDPHGGGSVPPDGGADRIAGENDGAPPRASSPMPNGNSNGGNGGRGGGGTAAVTPGLKAKEMMRFIDGRDASSPGEVDKGGDGDAGGRTEPAKKKTAAVGVSPGDSDKKRKAKPAAGAAAKAESKKPKNTLQNYFGKAGAGAKANKGAPSKKASKPAKTKTVHPPTAAPAPRKSKPSAKSAKSARGKKKSDASCLSRLPSGPSAGEPGKSTAAARPVVKLVIPPSDYPELVNVLEETTVIMRARSGSIAEAKNAGAKSPAGAEADEDPAEAAEPGPTEAANDRGGAKSAAPAGTVAVESGNDGPEAGPSKGHAEGSEEESPLVGPAPVGPAEATEDRGESGPAVESENVCVEAEPSPDSSSPAGDESGNDGVEAEPSDADADGSEKCAADEDDSDDSPKPDAEKPRRDAATGEDVANVAAGSVEVAEKSAAMEEDDDDDTVAMEIDPSKKSPPPADDDRTVEESSDEMEAEIEAAPIPAEIETSTEPADGGCEDDVAMDDADEIESESPQVEKSDEKDGSAHETQGDAQASSEEAPKACAKPQDKKKKKRDPNAPKGARTAFMFYKLANRDALKASHPDAKAAEINTLLSKHWKELDKEAKEPYQEQAKADKKRHVKETAEYAAKGGADEAPAAEPAAKTASPTKKSKQGKAGAAKGIASLASSFKKQEVTCPKRTSPAKKPTTTPCAPKPAGERPSSTPAKSPKPAEQPRAVLSDESAAKLADHSSRRDRWVRRAAELASRPGTEELEEENLSLGEAELPDVEKGSVEVDDGLFPDALLTHLLVLVQGR